MSKPTTLHWRTDPGHGWLIVTRAQLAAAGLTEADISAYSYQSGDLIALEEDCDARVYIEARYSEAEIAALTHDEQEAQGRDLPRNWAPFGTKKGAA